MNNYLQDEQRAALQAVRVACSITTKVFQTLTSAESLTKKDKSPVTIGDFSAQAAVNHILLKHFPQDKIVGEEDSHDLQGEQGASIRQKVSQLVNEALATSHYIDKPLSDEDLLQTIDHGVYEGGSDARFWTLDPIDGTKGFLRGGQYAVCLALIEKGRVELGVMGCPNLPQDKSQLKPKDGEIRGSSMDGLGALFVAVRGHGAYVMPIDDEQAKPEPVHMRDMQGSFEGAAFCESVEASHSSLGTNARIAQILGMGDNHVRMDSQAKYASISRGDGDVYLRLPVGDGTYQEKIWDHAAGALLVEEAGGRVSDIAGRPLNFGLGRTLASNKGVIACQSSMHTQLVNAVAQALKEEGRAGLLA
ncbi:3'(2'),5'-bisphosphate nucleotidase [Malassezia equina]|uniref:3'(2'),5'-bisphosphate nucleotidase n=1 Tax=Malassezia equina TaxID=1381935 RepID=A0AAF0EGH7_9BASI|nr:3'(2'),5'-bisphosphate nucleotidase [Malassezia equina]